MNKGGFTLQFLTDDRSELLFALNPESDQQRFLVMIGKQGATLDAEDTAKLLTWLSSLRDEVSKEGVEKSGK